MSVNATKTNCQTHCFDIEVKWGEMDHLGHVNNTVYLLYIEEARVSWLNQQSTENFMTADYGPVLVNLNINYRRALTWPGKISVISQASWKGGKSLTMEHKIVASDDHNTIYADATGIMVWVENESGKTIELPGQILEALGLGK